VIAGMRRCVATSPLSGVDLAGALLSVALAETPPAQREGREGILTRLGLMGFGGPLSGFDRGIGAARDRPILHHSAGHGSREIVDFSDFGLWAVTSHY
jgi:hypothetical protein